MSNISNLSRRCVRTRASFAMELADLQPRAWSLELGDENEQENLHWHQSSDFQDNNTSRLGFSQDYRTSFDSAQEAKFLHSNKGTKDSPAEPDEEAASHRRKRHKSRRPA